MKDVAEHLTKLNSIWSEIGYRLSPPGAQPVAPETGPSPAVKWGAGIAVVAAFVGLCLMLAMRRRKKPVPALAEIFFRPGEAPVSALSIRGTDEMHTHLAGLSCSCGAAHYSDPEVQRALYAEREMTIITRQCGACGREQSVYFTAA